MKTVHILLIATLSLFFIRCNHEKAKEEVHLSKDALEGTWKLSSYIDPDSKDTTWKEYPSNIIYEKFITPTHFTWVRYDKDKDVMQGTGGGTYVFNDTSYTEDILFFYPPGSNILGQAIPFSVEMEDGKWHHTGYAKVLEFNPEVGEVQVTDSSKIEEIWTKIDGKADSTNSDIDLVGSWELVSYMNQNESLWSDYPDFVGYIKHITPTHFVWVKYNADGDEVMSEGGGTYSLEGNTYTENIEFMYPSGSKQVGTSLPFTVEMKDGKWYHTGYVKKIETDPATGKSTVTDSTLIREIWKKYEGPKANI